SIAAINYISRAAIAKIVSKIRRIKIYIAFNNAYFYGMGSKWFSLSGNAAQIKIDSIEKTIGCPFAFIQRILRGILFFYFAFYFFFCTCLFDDNSIYTDFGAEAQYQGVALSQIFYGQAKLIQVQRRNNANQFSLIFFGEQLRLLQA